MSELGYSKKAEKAIGMLKDLSSIGVGGQIHLLKAILLIKPDCAAMRRLDELGINRHHFVENVDRALASFERVQKPSYGNTVVTVSLKDVLDKYAYEEAERAGAETCGTDHLLLAMIHHPDSFMQSIIREYGLERFEGGAEVKEKVKEKVKAGKGEEKEYKHSDFGTDLIEELRNKRYDPVIGRDSEIRDVINTLSRKGKNNPLLVGDPGVGKTAVVEGFAQRILAGDVPVTLQNKTIFSLDLASLLAGSRYRGDFEERLQIILKEIKKRNGDMILFIDEIHMIMGAGSIDGGSVDAANILKPMLARGELHCIGATTEDEYRKYIEKDPALERRFQIIKVDEPSVPDAISIMRGLKPKYEIFHGVLITDDAIEATVKLSDRYINDRFLPDKAIDLLDEACTRVKNELASMPEELDDLSRKVTRLEMDIASFGKDTSAKGQKRIENANEELYKAKSLYFERKSRWEEERASLELRNQLKSEIERLEGEVATLKRNGDIERAATLEYVTIDEKRARLKEEEARYAEDSMLHEAVTEEEIRRCVERWTGVPVTKLSESDKDKIIHLDDELHKRIIGQEEAVTQVAKAIQRSKAGINNPNRPIGAFLFLGPTGVGKTELAKAIAEVVFDDARAMVRFDMTEYMEKVSVSRLIGAAPGYVGYEEGGQLTEAVRRNPYSIVLFDEVEKAHPDVFNILLQVLDDGRLTDAKGRTVDFKNTIIILTSNLGAEYLIDGIQSDGTISEDAVALTEKAVRNHFKPEFINRLDEKVIFKPLSKENVRDILKLFIGELNKRVEDKEITLHFQRRCRDALIREGYDPVYGARPMKRLLQDKVESCIALQLLNGEIMPGDTIIVDRDKEGSYFARIIKDKSQIVED